MINHILAELIWCLPVGRHRWWLLARFNFGPPRRVIVKEINDRYFKAFGRLPDLENPQTWTEKLQWLKLNHRNSLMPVAADKYRVRDYVASRGLDGILTELISVYDTADEIDFESLPEQFVLKVNHDSGGVIVVPDKSQVSTEEIRARLKHILRKPYAGGVRMGEWHYQFIPRKILAEKYLGAMLEQAAEYRLHCMNGEVRFISVGELGEDGRLSSLYTPDWQEIDAALEFQRCRLTVARPDMLDELIETARTLAKDFVYVRVDLYHFESRIHFGELTFFPGAGFAALEPREWDHTFGSWLELPDAAP